MGDESKNETTNETTNTTSVKKTEKKSFLLKKQGKAQKKGKAKSKATKGSKPKKVVHTNTTKAKSKKGKPKLPAGDVRTVMVSCPMNSKEVAALEKATKAKGISRSEFMRQAIAEKAGRTKSV